jgi:phospholipid transport system substrate-binding protein
VNVLLALLAAATGLAAWGAHAASPAGTAPDVLVKEVSAEVIAVLKHDQAAGRATNVARLVEKKILPLFDFQRMTSMAVARNWRLATPEQQGALVAEFRTLLVRTYSVSLSSYRDEAIDYKPLRGGAGEGEALVRSSVKRPGAETLTIDYEMAHGPGGWKVYDVKVAGVSLVITYRESFASVVRDAGIDGLIKTLADKNRPYAPASAAAGK